MRSSQLGVVSPQLVMAGIAVLVLVALIGGSVLYVQHVRTAAFDEGSSAGRKQALLEVEQRDRRELLEAQAEIQRLSAQKEQIERRAAERVAQIDRDGQHALKDLESRHRSFLDDLSAGRVRLPGAGGPAAACADGGQGRGGQAAAAAGVGDGAARTYIPSELGKLLGAEARRADAIVLQLTACQDILRADRAASEGPPSP